MKSLLIVGAGGHGNVVAETAEACGYSNIQFVDDNNERAIGKLSDLKKLKIDFEEAFVGIGNNIFRDKIMDTLIDLGYSIPILIHPTAYLSKSANISDGTIVEPRAIVNAHTIVGRGSIISVGSIIDHDVKIGKACHINSGAIVKAGGTVRDYTKLEAGEVVLGYQSAILQKE